MNVLLLASHAVAEYDDVRMFHDLGVNVFAPGGYENPNTSAEGIRPALPQVPYHADLAARCNEVRAERGEPGPAIDWAKAALHDDLIDWADAIIVHHFVDRWVGAQWPRIRHKRVIWRTCGQSDPRLEEFMTRFARQGMQIVRYSPTEARYFTRVGRFAGQDALIRFGKYLGDYGPHWGDVARVGNITQDLIARGDACGYPFWLAATEGLPTMPAGKGSDSLPDGTGEISYAAMLDYLRHIRAYLYTGTRPASYTLALIEAGLSGVPIVSIGAEAWGGGWDAEDLFEGAELVPSSDDPAEVRDYLRRLLDDPDLAREAGEHIRSRFAELFDVRTVGAQWLEFLR